ncbi:membrane-associated protein [Nocardiopsis sp. TSRI0078]|uniref:DedA family protein n=1 Tax=unclassified Nocardiopsis TaxID=2649073 RepID=UPI00093B9733|nr:VTT domain-containing protein [Nocardiopsis sp. TSRI0078]OKI13691.1 membrane-associated protein [Nocardiopsis sp. TSRI0078]
MATTVNGEHAGENPRTPQAEGDSPRGAEGPLAREDQERERKKEEGRAALRSLTPWEGRATRQDKALMAAFFGLPLFFMALTPFKPFLIAHHPVLLEFVTGSTSAIGAAAAFSRIGEIPLWLVVVAGVFGKVKFDWLFWWVGRRWGRGIVNLLAPGERAQRFADRAQDMNPWIIRFALLLNYVPGVPSALVHVVAGWTGMRLGTFLALDVAGALLFTATVASVGYAAGQTGVDVVLMVDKYALWVSIGIILFMAFLPAVRKNRAAKAARG